MFIFYHHCHTIGFWKNASGVLESRGKVLEILVTKRVGTLVWHHIWVRFNTSCLVLATVNLYSTELVTLVLRLSTLFFRQKLNRRMHLSKVKHSKFNESGQLAIFYAVSAAWGIDLIVRVRCVYVCSVIEWRHCPILHSKVHMDLVNCCTQLLIRTLHGFCNHKTIPSWYLPTWCIRLCNVFHPAVSWRQTSTVDLTRWRNLASSYSWNGFLHGKTSHLFHSNSSL